MGLLALADQVGLDTMLGIANYFYGYFFSGPDSKVIAAIFS